MPVISALGKCSTFFLARPPPVERVAQRVGEGDRWRPAGLVPQAGGGTIEVRLLALAAEARVRADRRGDAGEAGDAIDEVAHGDRVAAARQVRLLAPAALGEQPVGPHHVTDVREVPPRL